VPASGQRAIPGTRVIACGVKSITQACHGMQRHEQAAEATDHLGRERPDNALGKVRPTGGALWAVAVTFARCLAIS
jgi:hypothetical protein